MEEVAETTVACFRWTVPAAVPGIVFLSGGQSDELATAHLDAMNALGPHPWQLSFSYGRALQAPALKAWKGEPANVDAGKAAFLHRARLNSAARSGSTPPRWRRPPADAEHVAGRPSMLRTDSQLMRIQCRVVRSCVNLRSLTGRVSNFYATDRLHPQHLDVRLRADAVLPASRRASTRRRSRSSTNGSRTSASRSTSSGAFTVALNADRTRLLRAWPRSRADQGSRAAPRRSNRH